NLYRLLDLILVWTLLALWTIFFTGWRKLRVAALLAVLFGGCWALFRVDFDGDLRATLHVRQYVRRLFGAAHDDLVAAQRQRQAGADRRLIDLPLRAGDFPGYRGADRTGVVTGPLLRRDWSARPPREIWNQLTYGGFASFAVVNGFLFTMEQRRDQ